MTTKSAVSTLEQAQAEYDAAVPPGWHMRCTDEYGDCVPVHYVRADGARVCLANDDFWANPNLPGYRAWCAVQPNGRTLCYHKRRRGRLSPFGSLRRWKTPEAAMRALDRECPMVAPGRENASS
jgi:hypothetical protein